jgi:hypothetical protein
VGKKGKLSASEIVIAVNLLRLNGASSGWNVNSRENVQEPTFLTSLRLLCEWRKKKNIIDLYRGMNFIRKDYQTISN